VCTRIGRARARAFITVRFLVAARSFPAQNIPKQLLLSIIVRYSRPVINLPPSRTGLFGGPDWWVDDWRGGEARSSTNSRRGRYVRNENRLDVLFVSESRGFPKPAPTEPAHIYRYSFWGTAVRVLKVTLIIVRSE